MVEQTSNEKDVVLEKLIVSAIQIPGVKVSRDRFLAEIFAAEDVVLQDILDLGPIAANVSREKLTALSSRLILKRTSQSSLASFAAGIPGGLAMAATIPADVLQFFGMSLRLAQELAYLYGTKDFWEDGQVDDEKIRNQLLLYCGVMFGVSGAVSGVRVLSAQIAKTTLKKLPQKALMKTFWYPMIKQIGKAIGVKVTKSTVAQGVSKAIPVIGGVVSGGLNFASMLPMANRLQFAFDSAAFGYSEEDLEHDLNVIENISEIDMEDSDDTANFNNLKTKIFRNSKKTIDNLTGLLPKKKPTIALDEEVIVNTISKLAELKENGIITQQEFDMKKTELLAKL